MFAEDIFRGLDYAIAQAGRFGLKVVVPLSNYWDFHDSLGDVRFHVFANGQIADTLTLRARTALFLTASAHGRPPGAANLLQRMSCSFNIESTGYPLADSVWLDFAWQYIDWAGVRTKDGFFTSSKAIGYAKSHVAKVAGFLPVTVCVCNVPDVWKRGATTGMTCWNMMYQHIFTLALILSTKQNRASRVANVWPVMWCRC